MNVSTSMNPRLEPVAGGMRKDKASEMTRLPSNIRLKVAAIHQATDDRGVNIPVDSTGIQHTEPIREFPKEQLTKVIALETERTGVICNAICVTVKAILVATQVELAVSPKLIAARGERTRLESVSVPSKGETV